jgi:hypothetical protein
MENDSVFGRHKQILVLHAFPPSVLASPRSSINGACGAKIFDARAYLALEFTRFCLLLLAQAVLNRALGCF